MSALPQISGREAVAVLRKFGYDVDRQRGSHIVLRHHRPPYRRLVVPDHKDLAKGTLRAIIRQAGLSIEEFTSAM